ncbi:MAG: hypothetical protein ABIQ70_07070 [Dokdonella sp.]
MTDSSNSRIGKIESLAQGGYENLARSAISRGASPDEFAVDVLVQRNRDVVTIAAGQDLGAGSILIRAYTTSVSSSGNAGNGTLSVGSIGPDAIEGIYTATCIAAHPDRGIFELRTPSKGVIGEANVGTAFVSDALRVTVADGSTDFSVGDKFAVEVIGGTYSGYSFFADEEAYAAGIESVQIAAGVLSAPLKTLADTAEQFATIRGPAVLPASFLKLWGSPWNSINLQNLQDAAMARSIDQLARRGIVLR